MAISDYSYQKARSEEGGGGGVKCSLSCLKFSLYCYNILLLIFGLCGFCIGLWSIIDRSKFFSLLTTSVYQVSGIIIIITGSIIVLITVIGCLGISRESNKLILVYGCLLSITILIQCTVGVTAYFYREQVHKELIESLNASITKDFGVTDFTTDAVNDLQSTFKCCGADGFEDYRNSRWWRSDKRLSDNIKVPDSCCKSISRRCGVRDGPSNIYYTGCSHKLSQLAGDHLILIGSVALVVCAVQCLGVFISVKLSQKLKKVGD